MTGQSPPHGGSSVANAVTLGVAAGVLGLAVAGVGVVVGAAVIVGAIVVGYITQEPRFSAPIEWQSIAQSGNARGDDEPVVVRLDTDGSARVEGFPITPSTAVPWPDWANNCYDERNGETYTGPATWRTASGGGIEILVLDSATGMSAGTFFLSQDWTSPQIFSCVDAGADIEFGLICGDPGDVPHSRWTPCTPARD
jgi:hypothetical protein